jgi:hypothetical protein
MNTSLNSFLVLSVNGNNRNEQDDNLALKVTPREHSPLTRALSSLQLSQKDFPPLSSDQSFLFIIHMTS